MTIRYANATVKVQKAADGYWLFIETPSGPVMLNLANASRSQIVTQGLLGWAKSLFASDEVPDLMAQCQFVINLSGLERLRELNDRPSPQFGGVSDVAEAIGEELRKGKNGTGN